MTGGGGAFSRRGKRNWIQARFAVTATLIEGKLAVKMYSLKWKLLEEELAEFHFIFDDVMSVCKETVVKV